MVKICFFDIDGTLLNQDNEIPTSTLIALKQLKEQGTKIFICTSRTKSEMMNGNFKRYINELDIDGYICCGGSLLVYQNETLEALPLSVEDSNKIIAFCEQKGLAVRYESAKGNYLHAKCEKWVEDSFIYFYDFVPEIKPHHDEEVLNFLIFDKETPAQTYDELLALVPNANGILFKDAYEITLKDINKGSALKKVCEHLKIDVSESMAFGDAENDIPLLQASGIGVAMGNAFAKCKESADFVTADVNDDGIMKALRLFDVL